MQHRFTELCPKLFCKMPYLSENSDTVEHCKNIVLLSKYFYKYLYTSKHRVYEIIRYDSTHRNIC